MLWGHKYPDLQKQAPLCRPVLELWNASARDKFLALAAPPHRLQFQRGACWQQPDIIIFEDTPGAAHTMLSVF